MLEIAKFKDDSGKEVSVSFADVANVICKDATKKEISLFLSLCQMQRLNPFAGDVYLVKYGSSPAQMITSKDVFVRRGNQNPNFEGFEAGIVVLDYDGKIQYREGSAFYPDYDEKILGGWCRVYVKGKKPYYDEVALSEYSTGKSTWKAMPGTMIRKVAIVHAFREAFNFQGMYTAEEMNQAGIPENFNDSSSVDFNQETGEVYEIEATEVDEEPSDIADDLYVLEDLARQYASLTDKETKDVFDALLETKALKSLGLETWDEVTSNQVEVACELLNIWIRKKTGN